MNTNEPLSELFIAFEGIDGSGKSTQIALLRSRLESLGYQVHQTCEPTTGPIGRMIRDIFSGKMEGNHHTIAGLFVADRLHHILNKKDGLIAQLTRGHVVLTDRYVLSSYAYQGAHVDLEWVIAANSESQRLLPADLHIFLDISVEEALERLRQGRDQMELFETRENLTLVHKMYQQILERFGGSLNIVKVDGSQNQDAIAEAIWERISPLFDR